MKARRHEFSAYFQDSWKTSRRLTLDFDARFEHLGFFCDSEGRIAGFDPRSYDPGAALDEYSGLVADYLGHDVPRSVWKSPALLISPRVGFAYDLKGDGRTVVRGGGGIYRYHGRGGDSFGVNNPPLHRNAYVCCGLFMYEPDSMNPAVTKSSINVLEPKSDAYPQTYSWSFTISQRLPGDIFWETSYVGNVSHHQLTSAAGHLMEFNLIPEGTIPAGSDNWADYGPYHSFDSIRMKRHMLSQNYHSMQVMLNRQTGAFNFAASYAFGKALGIGGSSWGNNVNSAFDIRNRSYGPLSYDRTHSFSIAYNWMLPSFTEQPVLGGFINGWQLTGITQFQSGASIRSLGLDGATSDGLRAANSVDIAGTPDSAANPFLICDPREGRQDGEWFNPRCFKAATRLNNGHFAWPYLKGPGFQNHDISLFKNWQLGSEGRKLQFRVSFYNFPNHPIPFFSGQETRLFFDEGIITDEQIAVDNVGRTALKKGRRIMQFALKYMF